MLESGVDRCLLRAIKTRKIMCVKHGGSHAAMAVAHSVPTTLDVRIDPQEHSPPQANCFILSKNVKVMLQKSSPKEKIRLPVHPSQELKLAGCFRSLRCGKRVPISKVEYFLLFFKMWVCFVV